MLLLQQNLNGEVPGHIPESYSGGWFDFPDRPRRPKVLREEAKQVIQRIKDDPTDAVLEEAGQISRALKQCIGDLEEAAQRYKDRLDLQAAKKASQKARELQKLMIRAQLEAEMAQQQIEEIDIAYITMMVAAHI